jgi:hypothetical protein
MLLKEKRNIVKSTGALSNKKFGVKINAKLINILSGLYSDQIKAIIRELSTNAADSHIMNGNGTQPFDIKLPSNWEPSFYIRDYGVGLSPEQVENVFTEYGASDKEDSNDYTGCLGLGSKTPFSYHTRTMTIESWYDGKHYIYNAHMGEDGIPEMSLLAESDSTEPTGVKITVPVAATDANNFKVKAEDVYKYFKIKPNFVGSVKPTIPVIEYSIRGQNDDWGIRKNSRDRYGYAVGNAGCNAVMGNICYAINFSDTNLSSIHSNIIATCPIDISFDIGDLDIAPDRESLSYDARTKNNIIYKLKDVADNIVKLIEDKVAVSKTKWEARTNFRDVAQAVPQEIIKSIGPQNIKWQGTKLFDDWDYRLNVPGKFNMHTYTVGYGRSKATKSDAHIIRPAKELVLMECDLLKGSHSRLSDKVHNSHETVVLFDFKDAAGVVNTTLRQELIDFLGIEDAQLIKTSTLPKVVHNTGSRGSRGHSTVVMKFKGVHNTFKTHCWENAKLDFNSQDGYYTELNTFSVVYNSRDIHPMNLKTISDLLVELKLWVSDDIYGVKTKTLPKIAKSTKNWTEFCQFALDKLKGELKKYDVTKIASSQDELSNVGKTLYSYYNNGVTKFRFEIDVLTEIGKLVKDKKSLFYTFYQEILDKTANVKDLETVGKIENAVSLLDGSIPKTYNKAGLGLLVKMENNVYARYPLLQNICQAFDKKDYVSIANYIDLIG